MRISLQLNQGMRFLDPDEKVVRKYEPREVKQQGSRGQVLSDLWCKYGCPEKMTIHVKRTGETITLIEGSPVTPTAEKNPLLMRYSKGEKAQKPGGSVLPQPVTLIRVCKGCKREFPAKRKNAEFCSHRCQVRFHRLQARLNQRAEHERLLAAS